MSVSNALSLMIQFGSLQIAFLTLVVALILALRRK